MIHYSKGKVRSESVLIHPQQPPKSALCGADTTRSADTRQPKYPPFGAFVELWGSVTAQLTTDKQRYCETERTMPMDYKKLPKTISAEELLSTPLPPVKWIIPGLLPAGLALFAGPSKAGKSWLTLWLCLQVAQGKLMWNREIEPHTVLYLSLEDTFNRLQKRLLQLVGSDEAPERLVMQTECSSIGQGLEEQLTRFIYQHPDTGLIVIDTLQKVRSCDQNNSMYASDYKEISALKALADKYNVCILLIHHLRKQAADDPFQQIAGSNGLMGASDTSWVMQRKRMSQTASILVTGRDMDNKALRLHEENCVWILDEEESTEQIAVKAVPEYVWKVADYIDRVGTWQGTATELLSAADVEGVLPHQLTRKIVEHFDTVFTPRGIRYETHRTSQARQMKFSHDENDADDANDANIDMTPRDISQTASSASLASRRSLEGSKHGRSVATGQPAEKPTGPATNPCEVAGA